jgi:hypothetical protein
MMLKKLLLALSVALSLVCSQAFAVITLVGTVTVPATDNTSVTDATPRSIVPPTVVTGDMLVLITENRNAGSGQDFSLADSWNQSWVAGSTYKNASQSIKRYCAIYNGTAGTALTVETAEKFGAALSMHLEVYRPTSGSALSCSPHVAEAYSSYSASTTYTATGQTPTHANSVTIAAFIVSENRTWSGATGGWTYRGGNQLRNATGTGQTISVVDKIQTSAVATGSVANTLSASNSGSSMVVTYSEQVITSATFTVSPVVSSEDDNEFVLAGATSVSDTVSAVACIMGQTAPTIPQTVAGDCTGGNDAPAATTDTWNGSDSLVLGGALTLPGYDIYVTNGDTLVSLPGSCLDDPTFYQYIGCPGGLTSILAGTPFDTLNASITPDIAVGDIPKVPLVVSPNGYGLVIGLDGDVYYDALGNTARQTFTLDVYDRSTGAYMPGGPTTIAVNNRTPTGLPYYTRILKTGVASSLDFCALAEDVEGDVLVGSNPVGTPSTGQAIGGTGNCILSGSPSAEFESGNTYVLRVSDPFLAYVDLTFTDYVFTTVTTPNCINSTVDECSALLLATNAGFLFGEELGSISYANSDTVGYGDIISQVPLAAAEVAPQSSFSAVVSLGAFNFSDVTEQMYPIQLAEKLPWLRICVGLRTSANAEASGARVWARRNVSNQLRVNPLRVPGCPRPARPAYP